MLLLYIQHGLTHPEAVDSTDIHGSIQNELEIRITIFNITQTRTNVYTRKIYQI